MQLEILLPLLSKTTYTDVSQNQGCIILPSPTPLKEAAGRREVKRGKKCLVLASPPHMCDHCAPQNLPTKGKIRERKPHTQREKTFPTAEQQANAPIITLSLVFSSLSYYMGHREPLGTWITELTTGVELTPLCTPPQPRKLSQHLGLGVGCRIE